MKRKHLLLAGISGMALMIAGCGDPSAQLTDNNEVSAETIVEDHRDMEKEHDAIMEALANEGVEVKVEDSNVTDHNSH